VEHLERRYGRFAAALLTAVAVQLFSLLLYAPALWIPPPKRFSEMYEPLVQNPWRTDANAEPQVRHRLLGPVIAHYLGLRGLWSTLPHLLAITGFLTAAQLLLRRHFDGPTSFKLLLLIGTTQAVITSQTWMGYQDSIGHFAVALCLLTNRAWLAALFLFVGMLADERTAAAVPLLVCWQFIFAPDRRWTRAIAHGLAGVVATAAWYAYLKWVQSSFVPPEALAGLDWRNMLSTEYYRRFLNDIPLGWFETLRAAWLLPILVVGLWWREGRWWNIIIFLGAVLLCLGQAGLVGDISRSAAFVWPAVIIAARALATHDAARLSIYVNAAVLINIFTPCYQVLAESKFFLYWPLPLSALRALAGF
jgi:hypothetical protein